MVFDLVKKVAFNMPLFIHGSIHLGDKCFSHDSHGKQCSYMSLLALLTEEAIHIFKWFYVTINSILLVRDCMYLDGLANA